MTPYRIVSLVRRLGLLNLRPRSISYYHQYYHCLVLLIMILLSLSLLLFLFLLSLSLWWWWWLLLLMLLLLLLLLLWFVLSAVLFIAAWERGSLVGRLGLLNLRVRSVNVIYHTIHKYRLYWRIICTYIILHYIISDYILQYTIIIIIIITTAESQAAFSRPKPRQRGSGRPGRQATGVG